MSRKIVRVCGVCGERFGVFPSLLKKGRGKHCSKPCDNEAKRRAAAVAAESFKSGRRCSACGIVKANAEFSRKSSVLSGYAAACKPCDSARKALAYRLDLATERAKRNAWRVANGERVAAWNRRTYERHHARIRSNQNQKRAANREQYREREKLYYEAHRAYFK